MNIKYIFFVVQCLLCWVAFAQQKSSNIKLPLSSIQQPVVTTSTQKPSKPLPIDTIPLFVKAKDSLILDSIVIKRRADSLIFMEYNEPSKSVGIPNASQQKGSFATANGGYVVKPIPNPFIVDSTTTTPLQNNNNNNDATINNNPYTPPPITNTAPSSSENSSSGIIIENINSKPSKAEDRENIRKYYEGRRYTTGYIGVGYNMSLVDVVGGIRLYQFNSLPIYFEIDLFFNTFLFKKFLEPVFVYRITPSINVGYTYEFTNFLNGMGLSASAGVGPYHEGYKLLTDVGFVPILRDQRFIKFAWNWAVDATFSLDKNQKYRLMLKHKMIYLTKSNFGNIIQSISVNMLFRLDSKKVNEYRRIENIYINY